MTSPAAFFAYARERQSILLRRRAGLPRDQWTKDHILKTYRFCNVFREDDSTTIWLRENVRDPMRDSPDVLLAVVLFRWFNRIATGEAIFLQDNLIGCVNGCTAWEALLNFKETPKTAVAELKRAILAYCDKGPYVTGSYIIKTPDGMSKLDGVIWSVQNFMSARKSSGHGEKSGSSQGASWRETAEWFISHRGELNGLEDMWNWLRRYEFLGDFMAYEIVSDLRYTALLDNAPDIMTWANPGPGAMRGLNRIYGRDTDKKIAKIRYIQEMRGLLEMSRDPVYWPRYVHDSVEAMFNFSDPTMLFPRSNWPEWDMRTVEHTLCEFDKYERVRLGEGAPRQKFK